MKKTLKYGLCVLSLMLVVGMIFPSGVLAQKGDLDNIQNWLIDLVIKGRRRIETASRITGNSVPTFIRM